MKKPSSYTAVGKNAHRVDGIEKVTGKAVYAGDIELPGMAYAKLLRSPMVHEGDVARAELRGSTYGAPERFKGTNICYYFGYERGNLDEAFKKADFVFEDTFRFHKVQHYSLEPHTNIAYYDGEKFTIWSSCQDPFTLRDHLSGIFRLPLSRIRVIVPHVGGGYGGKLYVKCEPIAAALSWKTRRPVT